MEKLSPAHQLPSLSQTSPINHVTSTETMPPASNLPHRIRKQSKSDAQTRQRRVAAVQAAKREVLATVKEDWTWPPSADQLGKKFPRRRKSTQWRERESDTSPLTSRSPSPSNADPYKYESPDAVAAPDRPRSKRRRLADDESDWNPGLRVFLERRDFWTGAESRPIPSEQGGEEPVADDAVPQTKSDIRNESNPSITTPSLSATTTLSTLHTHPSSPTSTSTQSLPTSTSSPPSTTPTSTRTSQSSSDLAPLTAQPPTPSQNHPRPPINHPTTLIPLPSPLLPPTTHPLLTPITPTLYPTLYTKCIVQSLPPSFPINLSHVVGALVQGWKDDGEWPPKTSILEGKGVGGKGGEGGGRKESLRGRMRALRVEMEEGEGLERVVGKGVGKVRRALGG